VTRNEKETLRLLTKFTQGRIKYTNEEITVSTKERMEIRETAQRDSHGGARYGEAPISKFRSKK